VTPRKVGILGAGQLGRMLALAGYPLALQFRFLDHSSAGPAGQVAPLLSGEFESEQLLDNFATGLDVATFEFENVPVAAVEFLSRKIPVYPTARALEVTQDRLAEKNFLNSLRIETAPYRDVLSLDQLKATLAAIGTPSLLKTRRMGYDGKGQARLAGDTAPDEAFSAVGQQPCVLEGFVPFKRELSLLSVRNDSGEIRYYPLVQNTHRDGILRESVAPAPDVNPDLQQQAELIASKVLQSLEYVGVLAIEFFQVGERLIVNEMAPRVHNSGHWTIEGAVTSQFENHLRAILDLPLGDTSCRGASIMLNCIGKMPAAGDILTFAGAHLHDYGKLPREGRKVGHVTITAANASDAEAIAARMRPFLS